MVFTDEQALIGDKGTLYSSTSEEAASSITDEILESSQPESQVRGNPLLLSRNGHRVWLDNSLKHLDHTHHHIRDI